MGEQFQASRRFFLVGPLRSGTSLLTRCLDDHPEAICLCESEINRALFPDYIVAHHCLRMNSHGFSTEEAVTYLDGRKQNDVASLEGWYDAVQPRLAELYDKPATSILGDKSPDFFRTSELVRHLAANHRLVYTTRDPRAVYASIHAQTDSSPEAKTERWESLLANYLAWKPFLGNRNLLVVRYEDLVRMPRITMRKVYHHLGLPDSSRFLLPFPRPHPYRFLWETAIDWETGIRKDFDLNRIQSWTTKLDESMIRDVQADDLVSEFMSRFGYE